MKRLLALGSVRPLGERRITYSLLALLLVAGIFPARGADRIWDGTLLSDDGPFHSGGSWSALFAPGSSDYAVFNLNSSYTVDWNSGGDVLNAGARFNGSGSFVTLDIGTRTWRLTNSLLVGSIIGADATVNQPSGTIIVTNLAGTARLEVGQFGAGEFRLNGGTVVADWLWATNSGTGFTNSQFLFNHGTLTTRRGSAIVQSNNFVIGNSNGQIAVWNITGGTNTITLGSFNEVVLGSSATRRGQVNVSGSGTVWSNHAGLYLGSGIGARSNRLVVSGGARVSSLISYLGGSTGASNNFALMTDAGSVWNAGSQLVVGNYGSGNALAVSNGASLISERGFIGNTVEALNNRVQVTGAGSSWTNQINLVVGDDTTGCELLITDGAVVQSGALIISSLFFATNITNTVTVENGTLVVTNHTGFRDLVVGEAGVGILRLNGGLIHARRLLVDRGPQSVLNFERGTLRVWNLQHSNGAPLAVGNGVDAARLELQAGGSNWLHGGLNIRAAGTLTGLGIIAGHVTNASGGTLAPGASPGELQINGHLELAAGSTSLFELHKALNTNDQIRGLTGVRFGGALVVTNLGGALVAGDSFQLFEAQAYTGAFASLTLPPLDANLFWNNRLALDGSLSVEAQPPTDCYWTNLNFSGGPFSAPINWLAHRPPGVRDTAIFTNPVSHQILFSAPAQIANAWFNGGTGSIATTFVDLGATTWTVTNQLVVGRAGEARAGLNLANGWLQVTNPAGTAQLIVGQDGQGSFTVNGGDVVVDRLIATNNVGLIENSSVNLSHGTFTTRRGSLIRETPQNGNFGIGTSIGQTMTWNMLGGTNTTDCSPVDSLLVGDLGRGIVWVDGPSTLWTNLGLNVSLNFGSSVVVTNGARVLLNNSLGVGTMPFGSRPMSNSLTVTEGGLLVCPFGSLGGPTNGSQNRALITGPGSAWLAQSLTVGNFGSSNQLVISNNAVVATRGLVIGSAATASSNAVVVEGGNLLVTNATATGVLELGRNGGGILRLRSGLVAANRLLATNSPAGTVDFSGGTLRPGGVLFSNNTTLVVGNGVSPATLDLTAGGTNVFARGLAIYSRAALHARGLIIGPLTNANGGTLAISPGLDRLGLLGNLTLQPGSTNVFKLNKTLGTNDHISVGSQLALGGTLLLTNLAGTLAPGDSFKLFSASSSLGAFHAISPAFPSPGLAWDTSTLAVDGTLRVTMATLPVLRMFSLDSTNNQVLTLEATNGQPGRLVFLLSTTNVGLPLTNWTVLGSNVFDANGRLGGGYLVPSDPARFFLLELK